jgi:hypothetical protein
MRYVLIVFVFVVSGCAHVAVWERGNLAKPQMALEPYPLQSTIQMHNYSSREAAASTHSSGGGGGCGCY